MRSTFTWLDYSEHDRRKMVDVVSAFREQDTRDELGIGSIRDGFADMLFPGTSTIQTRAAYFLFVPWMYLEMERKKVPSSKASQWGRGREVSLIKALEKSGSSLGNIGREAKDKLKRLPSNVYWQGLRSWGIRQFPGSQDQYSQSLERHYRTKGQMLRSDDKDLVSGFSEANWHPGIPPQPEGFPWEATFQLRPKDADYLKRRILCTVNSSLLAHLVRQESPPAETEYAWESEYYGGYPSTIRQCVHHARCFSEAIHGAALLYNLMLAQLAHREKAVSEYKESISDWAELIESRRSALVRWDLDSFWTVLDRAEARVKKPARVFVKHWLSQVLPMTNAASVADDKNLRHLISERERKLKRGNSRFDNPRALELWSGAAGTGRLGYRWGVSRVILTDILEGLDNA